MKLVLLLFALIYHATAQHVRCESFCRFRFCANLITAGTILQAENRAVLLGLPDQPVGPIPCLVRRSGKAVLIANVTGGEAKVSKEFSGDPFVPISQFMKGTVEPDFPEDFFSYVFNEANGRQSIASRPLQGNQNAMVDEVCVRIPVSSFNLLRGDGSIRKSVTPKSRRACIGFRTQVSKLVVKFRWFTSDNFDLRLEEPNGFEINREDRTSENGGRYIFDVGLKNPCDIELGKEQIRYLRSDSSVVEPGTYTIRVNHLTRCSEEESRYTLQVLYKNRLIVNDEGTISELGNNVLVRKFGIPRGEMVV